MGVLKMKTWIRGLGQTLSGAGIALAGRLGAKPPP